MVPRLWRYNLSNYVYKKMTITGTDAYPFESSFVTLLFLYWLCYSFMRIFFLSRYLKVLFCFTSVSDPLLAHLSVYVLYHFSPIGFKNCLSREGLGKVEEITEGKHSVRRGNSEMLL